MTRVLVRGHRFIDTDIFKYNGHWWLISSAGSHATEIMVYYSVNIEGPYAAHALNPITVTAPRNGGRPFVDAMGHLFRFAQVNFPACNKYVLV